MCKEETFIYSGSEIKSSTHVKRPNVGIKQNGTENYVLRSAGCRGGGSALHFISLEEGTATLYF